MVYTVLIKQGERLSNIAIGTGFEIPGSTPTAKLKVTGKHPEKIFIFKEKILLPDSVTKVTNVISKQNPVVLLSQAINAITC